MDESKLESLHEHNMQAALVYEQKQMADKERYEVVIEEDDLIITTSDYTKYNMSTDELRKLYD